MYVTSWRYDAHFLAMHGEDPAEDDLILMTCAHLPHQSLHFPAPLLLHTSRRIMDLPPPVIGTTEGFLEINVIFASERASAQPCRFVHSRSF